MQIQHALWRRAYITVLTCCSICNTESFSAVCIVRTNSIGVKCAYSLSGELLRVFGDLNNFGSSKFFGDLNKFLTEKLFCFYSQKARFLNSLSSDLYVPLHWWTSLNTDHGLCPLASGQLPMANAVRLESGPRCLSAARFTSDPTVPVKRPSLTQSIFRIMFIAKQFTLITRRPFRFDALFMQSLN